MANDEALKEKEQGNAAYKSKIFTKAIEHYQKVSKSFKSALVLALFVNFTNCRQ